MCLTPGVCKFIAQSLCHMPKNKDFQRRIELIDECLRRKQKKWSVQTLLDAINDKLIAEYGKEVSKRTLQNDLNYIQHDLQAPIEVVKEAQVYYYSYTDPNYSIKNIPVTEEEITYLKDALEMLKQVQGLSIVSDVEAIVTKLENTIDATVPDSRSYIQFEQNRTTGNEYIDPIFNAIKEKSALRITYQPFGKEPQEWLIHPYLLKEYRNRWFLIGRKDTEAYTVNIALDRIKKIRNAREVYLENDLFDPGVYFDNLVGVTIPIGSAVEKVEIRVKKQQLPYIITKPIHTSQSVVKQYKNGDAVLSLDLIINYELTALLLSYGSSLEVLKPESLRKELAGIAEQLSAIYTGARK